jgi:hypothetical protein
LFRLKIYVREALYPNANLPEQKQSRPVPPLGLIGELDTYSAFNAIARWNAIGSWSLEVPSDSPQARWFTPGRGIVVFREGEADALFSGPIRKIEKSWDADEAGETSMVKLSGVDDNVLLAERLTWTNPAQDIHWASKYTHWPTDPSWANVGELLANLLAANTAGQQDRWVPKLYVLRGENGLLDDETARATLLRFNQIDTEVGKMTSVYGFRINCIWHPNPDLFGDAAESTSGPGILVRIERVDDLTNEVQFGAHLGNIQSWSYSVEAPEATRPVIAGGHRKWTELDIRPTYDQSQNVSGYTEVEVQKEGPERYYAYFRNEDFDPDWWGDPATTPADMRHTLPWAARGLTAAEVEWGITAERLVDMSSLDWQWIQDPKQPAGYPMDPPVWSKQYRAIANEVAKFHSDNGPKADIKVAPVETPSTPAIYRDYGLGDKVRVHVDDEIRDEIVREVELVADSDDGHRANPTMGSDGATGTPYLYRQIKSLWASVRELAGQEDLPVVEESVPAPSFAFTRVEEDT